MSTTLEPPKPRTSIREIDVHAFEHHWQDEADAAYLYRLLARAEPDDEKKDIYARLAEVEDRHVVVWADLITSMAIPRKNSRPSGRASFSRALGSVVRPRLPSSDAAQEEGREVKAYLDMHRETPARRARWPRGSALAQGIGRARDYSRAIAGRVASRGIERSPAVFCGTSFTDSTMD